MMNFKKGKKKEFEQKYPMIRRELSPGLEALLGDCHGKVSRRTFNSMIKKAKEIGMISEVEIEEENGSKRKIIVFNRFPGM